MLLRYGSRLFVLAFLLLAVVFAVTTFNKIPHSVILHLNQQWHILLVGESDSRHVIYHGDDFSMQNVDKGNLWLQGQGQLDWQQNRILVEQNSLKINETVIDKSDPRFGATLLLYPNGQISKGKLDMSPATDRLK